MKMERGTTMYEMLQHERTYRYVASADRSLQERRADIRDLLRRSRLTRRRAQTERTLPARGMRTPATDRAMLRPS
jgi:hypothetical protein